MMPNNLTGQRRPRRVRILRNVQEGRFQWIISITQRTGLPVQHIFQARLGAI